MKIQLLPTLLAFLCSVVISPAMAEAIYPFFLQPKEGAKHAGQVQFEMGAKKQDEKGGVFVPSSGFFVLSIHTRPPSKTVYSRHLELPNEKEVKVELEPGQYKATVLYLSTDAQVGLKRPPVSAVNFSVGEPFQQSRGVASLGSAAQLSDRLKVAKYEPEIGGGRSVTGFRIVSLRPSASGDLSLRKGDIITKINGRSLTQLKQIRTMSPKSGAKKIQIDFLRDGVLHHLKID